MNNLLEPFVAGGTYLRSEPPIPTLELRLHTYSFERLGAPPAVGAGARPAESFEETGIHVVEKARRPGRRGRRRAPLPGRPRRRGPVPAPRRRGGLVGRWAGRVIKKKCELIVF